MPTLRTMSRQAALTLAALLLMSTALVYVTGIQPASAATSGTVPLAANVRKCLDREVATGRVQLWDCLGYSNQQWDFADDGSIRTAAACLETTGGQNGSPVRTAPCNGSDRQHWIVNAAAGTIESVAADKCLDVPSGNQLNGTSLQLWTCLGGSNQAFSGANTSRGPWTASFASAMQTAPTLTDASNFTCRAMSRLSVGGTAIRIHLSNRYSPSPATFTKVTVGLRATGASLMAGSIRTVTFGGAPAVTVAANREVVSDPLEMAVTSGQDVAVSTYLSGKVDAFANHDVATVDHYCTDLYGSGGDHSGDTSGSAFTGVSTNNAWVSAVDVRGASGAVVAIGDSITDGVGSTWNAYRTYPGVLSDRLRSAGSQLSVVNLGISGNTVVTAGGVSTPAASRFTRDVLSQSGVKTVLLMEGSNDIALGATAPAVQAGLASMAREAHAAGLRVVVGTIPPRHGGWFGGDDAKDAVRDGVNAYVRTSSDFDAVVDFDEALRNTDPNYPTAGTSSFSKYLSATLDSGDRIHPNDAGYAAMAQAVDLALL